MAKGRTSASLRLPGLPASLCLPALGPMPSHYLLDRPPLRVEAERRAASGRHFIFSMVPQSSPSDDRDIAVIERIQAGDTEAFESLVMEYQSLVTGLLYRFAPSRTDLEDLVQEAFLRVWKGIPGWRPDRPFVHWLKRVTVRTGLDFCSRQRRSPLARSETGMESLDHLASPDSTEEDPRESLEEARHLLSYLPPQDRALLTLLYLNEMPLAEVADHFGWSMANAKVKAFRARNRLRKTLKTHGYEFE